MVQLSLDLYCLTDRKGQFLFVSDACLALLGYTPEELVGRNVSDFISPEEAEFTRRSLQQVPWASQVTSYANAYRHIDGHAVPMEWTATWSEEEEVYYCVGRDVTERKKMEQALRENEERHLALLAYGEDMLALLDQTGMYTYVGGSTEKMMGYRAEELVGQTAFSFIHPEDLPRAQEAFAQLTQTQERLHLSGFRFKAASGQWRWIDTYISNQLQNPSIQALVVSSRDITEQTENQKRLHESEQKYRNLFEKNPDAIFQLNLEGIIVEANAGFEQVLGYQPDEVVGKPMAVFMPTVSADLATRYFKEALKGNTMRFDLELTSQAGERKVVDMVMYPVAIHGQTIGIETIAKDITPMVRAYETIQAQAKKLNTMLESITDAFFTVDRQLKFTYINQELERILDIDRNKFLGHGLEEVFPEEILQEFRQNYQLVQATQKSSAFEVYLQKKDIWLGVKFFPSEEGLSVYLIDITQRVAYQRELKMLSLVASKTINGVVIMDSQQRVEWVNDGFTALNGYVLSDVIGKTPSSVLQGPATQPAASRQISEGYASGQPFTAEVLNFKKNGDEFWVRLEVTPIKDPAGNLIRYIAIQTDVTAQRKADESQARLTQELYRQNRDLQQFTYIVSHNLRAPVANVMGLANLLHDLDKSSENFALTLHNLDKSILAIDAVLKDLSEILSIGFTKDTVNMETVELARICQEALDSLQESLTAFGAEVQVEVPPGTRVFGNKAYLFSIFHNLLSNAIKYRSTERQLHINIRVAVNQKWVVLFFSDNGLGFDDKKAADKVFKLYKRFHRNIEGRGIGLFLVKTQVDAMGGEIEVTSAVNVGTRFLIHLRTGTASE